MVESMVIGKRFEPPDLVGATLSGVITAQDQANVVDWVRTAVRHLGHVRLLIVLDGSINWVPDPSFDSRLWLADDEGVTQIAIVGRDEWRAPVLTMVAQPIRRLPIRYFEAETDARQWLKTGPVATTEKL
jgi:hypothetical protein